MCHVWNLEHLLKKGMICIVSGFLCRALKTGQLMLEAQEPKPQALIDKIQKFRKENMPEIAKAIFSESRVKYSKLLTMVHGDFWNNNIMVNDSDSGMVKRIIHKQIWMYHVKQQTCILRLRK